MSDDKKSKRTTGETARRIWLAGLGAYGRAFSEAQEAIKDVTGGTSKIFDELVQKGEMIETVVETKSKDMMSKAPVPSMPSVPGLDLDDRIAKMRSRLMGGAEVAEDISDMEKRLDAVEAKLDKILSLLEDKKPAPRKRTTTTKKTAPKKKSD